MIFGSAPAFWWRPDATWQAKLLAPAGEAYGFFAGRAMRRPGAIETVPVICIGNFTVGGAGKTPTAIALAEGLKARGHAPAFLSRGYGRKPSGAGVIAVDPGRHGARDVGDEPLLLCRHAPTFVAANRILSARAAVAAGASILLMDDGLQNPALAKSAAIAVVDGGAGIGNSLCVPAGPLRAPMPAQWPKISALCVIGEGIAGERVATEARKRDILVVGARIEADPQALDKLRGRRLFAFSGIGRPRKFFETLEASGLDVVACRAFADHHVFDGAEQSRLAKDAALSAAELVTTDKDRVRLPPGFPTHVLPIRLVFDKNASVVDALLDRFSDFRKSED